MKTFNSVLFTLFVLGIGATLAVENGKNMFKIWFDNFLQFRKDPDSGSFVHFHI